MQEQGRRRRRVRHPAPAPPPALAFTVDIADQAGDTDPAAIHPDAAHLAGDPAAAPALDLAGDPATDLAADPASDPATSDRGLRGLVGSGASQVKPTAALRARDAARPRDDDLARAEAELVVVRRNWTPRD